jgi:hypothetical protein
MPNVPVAPKFAAPFSDANRGAKHQRVKGAAAVTSTPADFVPVPVGSGLTSGTAGTAYTGTIHGTGGTAPYSFAVTSGSLPTGLSLSAGGTISGTPTVVQTSTFTVTVTDANAYTGSQSFTLIIAAPASGGGAFCFVG